jgi:hypothetical protein
MEDDLIAGLTHEVKEDVIQNYLMERRILELQIENLQEQARRVREHAAKSGLRLARLGFLMISPEMLERLKALLQLREPGYWMQHVERSFNRGVRFIRVRAFRERIKFRKLILEAYHRLYTWMHMYRKAHEELEAECRAVNKNIESFHQNYDLLSILSFLRSLDTSAIEQKQYLGENFTPEEMASVDQKLYIRPIDFSRLDVPAPHPLPGEGAIEEGLTALANAIYTRYENQARGLMQ